MLGATPAMAQQICAPADDVRTRLEQKFGEHSVGAGVSDGKLVELLTTKDGMTWTIIQTTPKGESCLIAAGEGWRVLEPVGQEPEA